jgi:hypothetical protein
MVTSADVSPAGRVEIATKYVPLETVSGDIFDIRRRDENHFRRVAPPRHAQLQRCLCLDDHENMNVRARRTETTLAQRRSRFESRPRRIQKPRQRSENDWVGRGDQTLQST